ncbi:hypothetical protein ACU4GI_46870 (plasmid) [Cupriavidus basilensis]
MSKATIPATTKRVRRKQAPEVETNPPMQPATKIAEDPAQRAVVALCAKQDHELDVHEERLVAGVRALAAAIMAHPALLDVGPGLGAAVAGGPALPMLIQRFVSPMLSSELDTSTGRPVEVDLRWRLMDQLLPAAERTAGYFWVFEPLNGLSPRRRPAAAGSRELDPRQTALF